MLARANRVNVPAEIRETVRTGRRSSTPVAVVYSRVTGAQRPPRFGFIVGKTVGDAVERNLVKRRLRAIGREYITVLPLGTDIVVRALPASGTAPWDSLHSDVAGAIEGSVRSR